MKINFLAVKYLLLVLGLFVFAHYASAQIQSVTATAGSYLQGQNVSVSYTLGESIINTLENPNLKITQGFHQTKLMVTAIDEMESLAINIKAYPNPVTDNLSLVVSEMLSTETTYALFNSYGELIFQKKLDALNTKISFQNLVPAVYILKVGQGATTLKSFKVIKK